MSGQKAACLYSAYYVFGLVFCLYRYRNFATAEGIVRFCKKLETNMVEALYLHTYQKERDQAIKNNNFKSSLGVKVDG